MIQSYDTIMVTVIFRIFVEGKFTTSDGLPLNYTNWYAGEPDDGDGAGADCIRVTADGFWRDRDCERVQKYVCETFPTNW